MRMRNTGALTDIARYAHRIKLNGQKALMARMSLAIHSEIYALLV